MNEFYGETFAPSIVFGGGLLAFSLKASSVTRPDHAKISPQKRKNSNIAFIQGFRKNVIHIVMECMNFSERRGMIPRKGKAMRLFHVTSSAALPAILEEGLKPLIGPRAELLGEVVPAVYCFGDRNAVEDGLMGWMSEAFEEGDILILEIDAKGLAIEKNPADFEFRILTCVAPTRITSIFDEMWDEIPPEHGSKACNPAQAGLALNPAQTGLVLNPARAGSPRW